MRFENRFHSGGTSRFFVSRAGDAAAFGAGRMFAEQTEGAGRGLHRQTQIPFVPDSPRVDDGMQQAPSSYRPWRAISTTVFTAATKAAVALGACGELLFCRILLAILSWVFEQALEGCAAYAAAMYGIPHDEFRGPEPQTGHGQNRPTTTQWQPVEDCDLGDIIQFDIEYLKRNGGRRE